MARVMTEDNRIVYFDPSTGNYKIYDGEKWLLENDGFGEGVIPYAVVGTAIVGKDIVGPSEVGGI